MSSFHIYIFCSVLVLGILFGIYAYTKQGVVSERTIHAIEAKCSKFQNIFQVSCLRREIGAVMRSTNVDDIMHAVLMDSYHADDANTVYNSPNCHALAHVVGETAGIKLRVSIPRLFSMCGTGCVYGCVHGMFSGLLKQGKITKSTITTVCDDNTKLRLTSHDREACIHGIGHGLADYMHNDIPKAVLYCDSFVSLTDKKLCWDGIFMQLYGPVTVTETIRVLPADLFVDCREHAQVVRRSCMQSLLAVQSSVVRDIGYATGVCEGTLSDLDACIGDVDAYNEITLESEESIRDQCKHAQKEVYSCVDSFIHKVAESANGTEQIEAACNTNGIVYRNECLNYMKKQQLSWGVQ